MKQKDLLARLDVLAGQASQLARDIDVLKRQIETEPAPKRKGGKRNVETPPKRWNDAERATAVRLANSGQDEHVIAAELGRTHTSVRSQLHTSLGVDGYATWRALIAA